MFETLHAMTTAHAERSADALYMDGQVAFLVDPCGVHLLLTATPAKPYEVDFAAVVRLGNAWVPAPMTTMQFAVIHSWTSDAIPRICKKWKARHPDGPRAPEPQEIP
jgi:hypothetical protein